MEEVLYHATYGEYINSIKEKGLGAVQHKNWEFSEDGVVYFTPYPDTAISFSEAAEEVSDSVYNSGIVLLGVPTAKLNPVLLERDHNIVGLAESISCAYRDVVPPEDIYVTSNTDGSMERLLKQTAVPAHS